MDGSYGEQFKHWCFGERKVERLNINITGNGSGNGKSNVNGKGVVIVMVMVYDNSKIKQLSVVLYIIHYTLDEKSSADRRECYQDVEGNIWIRVGFTNGWFRMVKGSHSVVQEKQIERLKSDITARGSVNDNSDVNGKRLVQGMVMGMVRVYNNNVMQLYV